jgi:hypothetical protein
MSTTVEAEHRERRPRRKGVGQGVGGGNPNFYKGMPSNNPGGRRKWDKGAKDLMAAHTVEAVDRDNA